MPCDTVLKPRQTIQQRAEEVRRATANLDRRLAARQVKPVIGPTGGITFVGWPEAERDGITDACAYRRLMVSGSASAKMAITRAEQISGRTVDKTALARGVHSHDNGKTWVTH
jgi:hypothetical protein